MQKAQNNFVCKKCFKKKKMEKNDKGIKYSVVSGKFANY
jgi:hypothetical protein